MMSRNNPKRFKSLPMPRNPVCPLKMHCEMSSRELSVTMASLAVFGNVPRPLTDNLLYKSTSNSPTAVKLTLPFNFGPVLRFRALQWTYRGSLRGTLHQSHQKCGWKETWWVGWACVLDRGGNARKNVGASCVVVKDYGEESEALSVLLDYFKTR
jgi:hypothetical protein